MPAKNVAYPVVRADSRGTRIKRGRLTQKFSPMPAAAAGRRDLVGHQRNDVHLVATPRHRAHQLLGGDHARAEAAAQLAAAARSGAGQCSGLYAASTGRRAAPRCPAAATPNCPGAPPAILPNARLQLSCTSSIVAEATRDGASPRRTVRQLEAFDRRSAQPPVVAVQDRQRFPRATNAGKLPRRFDGAIATRYRST